ncbi:MAG: GNAT family N-acetyltransferase [Halanaeroarchaeum sp.]
MSQLATDEPQYTVRRFTPNDVADVLELYEEVWYHERTGEWLEWRFGANPLVDDVQMIVAEAEGTVVGTEPALVFRLRAGDQRVTAYQPADWMVHPEHRRRGVFSRMTESFLETFGNRTELYFNFPSEVLVPGLEKFDWTITPPRSTRYRIQDPAAILARRNGDGTMGATMLRAVARAATPLSRGYLHVRDRLAITNGVTVERHDSIPASAFVSAYERGVPDALHVERDEPFYGWRFENPLWETTAYLARRDGDVEMGVVTATEERSGVPITSILEVVPLDGSAGAVAYGALLQAIVSDARDAALIQVSGDVIPEAVARRFGFLSTNEYPLSRVTNQPPLAVRPADERLDSWHIGPYDPTNQADWHLSLADRDVA